MHRQVVIACLPYLIAIVVLAAFLCWLLRVSGGRAELGRLAGLHRDQTGAVQSLSFVLTLPVFVMFMMFIVQLSQLTIGRVVVEYAGFAAARSAIVWIPANLGPGTEQENRIASYRYLGEVVDDDGLSYSEYRVEPVGPKYNKIHFAAAMACMSISPSRDVGSSVAHPDNGAAPALTKAYYQYAPGAVLNSRVPARLRNKLAYALNNTQVEIVVRHKETEPDLQTHLVGPYPEEFTYNEIGWHDQIVVTVRHRFALLPGPGRLLAGPRNSRLSSSGSSADNYTADSPQTSDNTAYETSGNNTTVFTYNLQTSVRLSNEGEKPVLPYIQRTYGGQSSGDSYSYANDNYGT